MKKTLLLAGVACLFSFGANAADYSLSELRPYVGLDYVYTDANIKKETRIKTDYNSGAINAGIRFYDYLGLEAFFQQSGERKSMKARWIRPSLNFTPTVWICTAICPSAATVSISSALWVSPTTTSS